VIKKEKVMNPVSLSSPDNVFSQFNTPSYVPKTNVDYSSSVWNYETLAQEPKKKKRILPALLVTAAVIAAVALTPKMAEKLKIKQEISKLNPDNLLFKDHIGSFEKLGDKVKYTALKSFNKIADKVKSVEEKIQGLALKGWERLNDFVSNLKKKKVPTPDATAAKTVTPPVKPPAAPPTT